MLKMRIIPCLDVKDGRVVKGVQVRRSASTPATRSSRRRLYDAAGADELTFLDITASHENRDTHLDVVARTAEQCFMPLTVGGGVRAVEDIRTLLLAGADKVSINTAAVARPDFVARGRREVRRPVHRGGDRRQADGAGQVGGLHPWRPQAAPASTPSTGRAAWRSTARARSC